jgi:hypothetical protein
MAFYQDRPSIVYSLYLTSLIVVVQTPANPAANPPVGGGPAVGGGFGGQPTPGSIFAPQQPQQPQQQPHQQIPTNIASGAGAYNPFAGLTGARYAGQVPLPSASMFGPDRTLHQF